MNFCFVIQTVTSVSREVFAWSPVISTPKGLNKKALISLYNILMMRWCFLDNLVLLKSDNNHYLFDAACHKVIEFLI